MVAPSRPWAGFFKSKIMTKQERKEFLSKPAPDNAMLAAQKIAALGSDKRYQIATGLKRLKDALTEEWAKGLTLGELLEAIEMIK